jgi:hypothetical protein
VAALIALGADVNAVGKNDMMPLKIALEQKCDVEQSENVALITKMLQESGAKASVKALLRGGSSEPAGAAVSDGAAASNTYSTAAAIPFTTSSMVSVSSGGSTGKPQGGSVIMDEPAHSEPKVASVTASSVNPVLAAATGAGGFVRFTGAAGGAGPLVASSSAAATPITVFTSFSSSTQAMNSNINTHVSPPASVNMTSTGAGGGNTTSSNELDSEAQPRQAYSDTSDDGGMMFSTSS